jgi:hypothetical protein
MKIKPQWDTLNFSPLNPPFWGTLKGSEVPQNGGFRGLFGALYHYNSPIYFAAALIPASTRAAT